MLVTIVTICWLVVGNVIIPIDVHIFQRGGSTTNQGVLIAVRDMVQVFSFPYPPWCWNIYLQNWAILGVNVGKYAMEHLDLEKTYEKTHWWKVFFVFGSVTIHWAIKILVYNF